MSKICNRITFCNKKKQNLTLETIISLYMQFANNKIRLLTHTVLPWFSQINIKLLHLQKESHFNDILFQKVIPFYFFE